MGVAMGRVMDGYAGWRASLPWTDAEFLTVMERLASEAPNAFMARHYQRMAEHLARTGRLTRVVVALTLPFLITRCGLCGKTALYRYGNEGRCRAHRFDVPPAWRRYYAARYADKDAYDANETRIDRMRAAAEKHHAARGRGKGANRL